MPFFLLIILVLIALAVANGANDVSKGVATLVGGNVARYRTAILWGAVTTLAGSLLSGFLATRMLSLFTTGIVSSEPSPAFTLAVLCGAATWILIATWTQLPVSTTHAIIGSLFGAGMIFSPNQLIWTGALPKFALPLLLSIAVAYLFSAVLNRFFARKVSESGDCVCVGVEAIDAGSTQFMQFNVVSAPSAECENAAGYLKISPEALHWLSSGSVGFARGLNDTPKLVAIGVILLGHININVLVAG